METACHPRLGGDDKVVGGRGAQLIFSHIKRNRGQPCSDRNGPQRFGEMLRQQIGDEDDEDGDRSKILD